MEANGFDPDQPRDEDGRFSGDGGAKDGAVKDGESIAGMETKLSKNGGATDVRVSMGGGSTLSLANMWSARPSINATLGAYKKTAVATRVIDRLVSHARAAGKAEVALGAGEPGDRGFNAEDEAFARGLARERAGVEIKSTHTGGWRAIISTKAYKAKEKHVGESGPAEDAISRAARAVERHALPVLTFKVSSANGTLQTPEVSRAIQAATKMLDDGAWMSVGDKITIERVK